MSCLETDFISPKHAAFTTISKANVVPVTTVLTFSSTEVTTTFTSFAVGKSTSLFVSLHIPTLDFTGDGTTVTCAAISGLTAPYAACKWPVAVLVGSTTQTGMITLGTDKTIVIAASEASGTFTGATVCKVYPVVLTYSSY